MLSLDSQAFQRLTEYLSEEDLLRLSLLNRSHAEALKGSLRIQNRILSFFNSKAKKHILELNTNPVLAFQQYNSLNAETGIRVDNPER